MKERILEQGQIQSGVDQSWHFYTMRLLHKKDLADMLALYDEVVEGMEDPSMLWRYPDEKVAAFLGENGLVIGVFIEAVLVGFRVLYFHPDEDEENPLLCKIPSPGKTAHLALCVLRQDFRGNSLQKKMGIPLLKVAQAMRPFDSLCSIVSPHNYPSIEDKFSLNMVVLELMPKFKGLWRYILYRNMNKPALLKNIQRQFAASQDYVRQQTLLKEGYYGIEFAIEQGTKGVLFQELDLKL